MKLINLIQPDGLFSGYSFREKIQSNPEGDVGVLQMKDITNNYTTFDYNKLDKVNNLGFKDKSFLQKGDILFVSKGLNNYALLFDCKSFPMIASATFFVIRTNREVLSPEYLAWYINQKDAQNYLIEKKAGTYVPNLTKQDILDLPVKVPPVKMQRFIAKTAELLNQEISILDKIKENRTQLIQTQLLNLINNE